MSYSKVSPYYFTPIVDNLYLDVMQNRRIPMNSSDQSWTINQVYHLRPDLLAHDLYNESKLWWVFAQRNPNKLKDPLFDFVSGTSIYIPTLSNLKVALGF